MSSNTKKKYGKKRRKKMAPSIQIQTQRRSGGFRPTGIDPCAADPLFDRNGITEFFFFYLSIRKVRVQSEPVKPGKKKSKGLALWRVSKEVVSDWSIVRKPHRANQKGAKRVLQTRRGPALLIGRPLVGTG